MHIGTISYAVGSGACSDHSGVAEWIKKRLVASPWDAGIKIRIHPTTFSLMSERQSNLTYVLTKNRENEKSVEQTNKMVTDVIEQNSFEIGSTRQDVLKSMGVPTAVRVFSGKEVLRYGLSTITLKDGFVEEYDNLDGNLRVTVQ
jgi:hypothetical protein